MDYSRFSSEDLRLRAKRQYDHEFPPSERRIDMIDFLTLSDTIALSTLSEDQQKSPDIVAKVLGVDPTQLISASSLQSKNISFHPGNIPQVSTFKPPPVPKISGMPTVSTFKLPTVPKISGMPTVPILQTPTVPKISGMPTVPILQTPTVPKISGMPTVPILRTPTVPKSLGIPLPTVVRTPTVPKHLGIALPTTGIPKQMVAPVQHMALPLGTDLETVNQVIQELALIRKINPEAIFQQMKPVNL